MMGYNAVKALIEGKKNRVMVYRDGHYDDLDLDEALAYKRGYDNTSYEMDLQVDSYAIHFFGILLM